MNAEMGVAIRRRFEVRPRGRLRRARRFARDDDGGDDDPGGTVRSQRSANSAATVMWKTG